MICAPEAFIFVLLTTASFYGDEEEEEEEMEEVKGMGGQYLKHLDFGMVWVGKGDILELHKAFQV